MRLSLLLTLAALAGLSCAAAAPPPPSGKVTSIPLLPAGVELSSYAGYITVNENLGANLFYWMFEAQTVDPSTAPLLVWLNGGPGSSSMYGLFSEQGPFSMSADGSTLEMRTEGAWTSTYNVIFIDNPVGTGFSYTESAAGFVTNQVQVGQDLLSFLYQFLELYPQYQKLPLYICGESYAGKYVPAFSYAIHEANAAHKAHLASLESSEHAHASSRHHIAQKHQAHQRAHAHAPHLRHSSRSPAPHGVPNGLTINLAGLSIGDGMMDPPTQVPGYGKYLYGLSLIDESQRDYMTAQEAKISDLMNQQQWVPAFRLFDPLMMGDEFPYPSTFTNFTGFTDYYNFDTPTYPNNDFTTYLNRADVKAALHVDPDYVYSSGNNTVEEYLLSDWMQSVAPWVVTLLESYPVLIYNGQNDIILNAVQCEQFLAQLQWQSAPGSSDWHSAPRQIWKVKESDYDVAGYVKQQTPVNAPGLTYVIVREAGHLVPQDQPVRAYDMINRYIQQLPFSTQE